MRPLVAHCHLGLGKLYRRTAKREQAQEHLATATTMYREMDMQFWPEQAEAEIGLLGYEVWALYLLGGIYARIHGQRDAVPLLSQALPLAEGRGMRPVAAHCHLGLSKLYRRIGQREQAQEHLTTATAMFREMDMAFWLEKAEAETSE